MTTTTTDISNMALLTIGTQKQISSLNQDSAEAKVCNRLFNLIQTWSFGLTNWNFARNTAELASAGKNPPIINPPGWSSGWAQLPWLYEYLLPSDFVRAIYMTNNDVAAPKLGWSGEPKRFVLGVDYIQGIQQEVIYTNEAEPIFIYTATVLDPTRWPWHFQALIVYALAKAICLPLTQNLQLYQELTEVLEQQINIAIQINTAEGLIIADTTPEWIQATGINYPYRRIEGRALVQRGQQRRNQKDDQ